MDVGSVVRYHLTDGVDVPALVVACGDAWGSEVSEFYGIPAPAAGTAVLLLFQNSSGPALTYETGVREGTGLGEFSVLAVSAGPVVSSGGGKSGKSSGS